MSSDRDDQHIAGEYALGLLDGDALVEAERRLVADPGFARMVEDWRTRLAELDHTAEPMAASRELWERISATVSAPRPAAVRTNAGAWRAFTNSLRALRLAAAGGTLAAIAFAILAAVFFTQARDEAARKPVYVAILVNDTTRQAGAVVNAFGDGRVELIPLVDIDVPAGRVLEIWTLWDRSVGPRSVGLIGRARTTRLSLDSLPRTAADQLFEITLEPSGGSPIGRPTGPILFKGTTARVL